MEFNSYTWADSNIERIEIEYDCAKIFVFNYTLQRNLYIICTGFIGMTNLCIWDDTIIDCAEQHQIADDEKIPFMETVYSVYDKDFNYGERYLRNGVVELHIKLVNNLSFDIYCQSIIVEYA